MHKFTKLNYEILIPRYRAGVLETQIFSAVNHTNSVLAGGATLVAVAFSLSTFDRWHRRNQPHELAWTIAMALFTIGSAALWWAEATGWSMFAFRVFFLAGAVLNVAWLALGTIYLLVNKKLPIIFEMHLLCSVRSVPESSWSHQLNAKSLTASSLLHANCLEYCQESWLLSALACLHL